MVIRTGRRTFARAALAALSGLAALATGALADGPGPVDDAAFEPRPHGLLSGRAAGGRLHPLRPPRRVTGGPGYVGSEWGLGKPSFYGIGPRPDWGRSAGE